MVSLSGILKGIGSYVAGNIAGGATSLVNPAAAPAVQAGVTKGTYDYFNSPSRNNMQNNQGDNMQNNQAGDSGYNYLDPRQQQLRQLAIQRVQDLLNGQQPQGFQDASNIARNNFNRITVPSLAERFRNMGDTRGSSDYQPALSSAGSDLEERLKLLQQQYGQNQLGQLLPYTFGDISMYKPEQPASWWDSLNPILSKGIETAPDFYKAYQMYNNQPVSNDVWGNIGKQIQDYRRPNLNFQPNLPNINPYGSNNQLLGGRGI